VCVCVKPDVCILRLTSCVKKVIIVLPKCSSPPPDKMVSRYLSVEYEQNPTLLFLVGK
jgi:hypothetical protein